MHTNAPTFTPNIDPYTNVNLHHPLCCNLSVFTISEITVFSFKPFLKPLFKHNSKYELEPEIFLDPNNQHKPICCWLALHFAVQYYLRLVLYNVTSYLLLLSYLFPFPYHLSSYLFSLPSFPSWCILVLWKLSDHVS